MNQSTRKTKNDYVLAYFECLLVWGVFNEIPASLLSMGPTNEDKDRSLSSTSSCHRSWTLYYFKTFMQNFFMCFMCLKKTLQDVDLNIFWNVQLVFVSKNVYNPFLTLHSAHTFDFCASQTVLFHRVCAIAKQLACWRKCIDGLVYFTNGR